MAKFTFTIDTGHAPMRSTEEVAAALKKVANLIEPWGSLYARGRDVIDSGGIKLGEWDYVA